MRFQSTTATPSKGNLRCRGLRHVATPLGERIVEKNVERQHQIEADLFYKSWNPAPFSVQKSVDLKNTIALKPVIMGCSKPHLGVIVVEVDLTVHNGGSDLDNGEEAGTEGAEVPDAEEESVGAYILVNWDDDDGDYEDLSKTPEPDLTQGDTVNYVTVENEDNLAKLSIKVGTGSTTLPTEGFVSLECSQEDDKVSFWSHKTKGTRIIFAGSPKKHVWDLSDSSRRATLQGYVDNGIWIEGMDASGAEKDVSIKLKYSVNGSDVGEDNVKATVQYLRLGNIVFAENTLNWQFIGIGPNLEERGHSAFVHKFNGPLTRDNLLDLTKYSLAEMVGGGPQESETLDGMASNPDLEYWGCYSNTTAIPDDETGYVKRLQMLKTCRYFITNTDRFSYSGEDGILISKDAHNFSETLFPSWKSWDGTLDDIYETRCDGFTEIIPEWNDVMIWGKTSSTLDFRVTDANGDYPNLKEHNVFKFGDDPEDGEDDLWGWLQPITQCGYADTYIFNSPHHPFPYTGSGFDYSSTTLRGHFWVTQLSQQDLAKPLNPETSPAITR